MGRLPVFLLMLLALLGQSFITQTHVHLDPAYSSAPVATGGTATELRSGQPAPELPATCPLCQEAAHAGAWLLPTPVAFQVPRVDPVWRVDLPARALGLHQRAHAWQSRAPPLQLQA